MKLSVSLPEEDVAELDRFARSAGLPSRSVAVGRPTRRR
ncbi:ribbon-helix-helix protein, CopG family [Patulibacter sp. S7RM1-6]